MESILLFAFGDRTASSFAGPAFNLPSAKCLFAPRLRQMASIMSFADLIFILLLLFIANRARSTPISP